MQSALLSMHRFPEAECRQKEADRKIQTNNISGHTGVYWNIQRGKWVAEIQRNGVKHYLGGFDSVDDAVKARKEAEKRLLQPKEA